MSKYPFSTCMRFEEIERDGIGIFRIADNSDCSLVKAALRPCKVGPLCGKFRTGRDICVTLFKAKFASSVFLCHQTIYQSIFDLDYPLMDGNRMHRMDCVFQKIFHISTRAVLTLILFNFLCSCRYRVLYRFGKLISHQEASTLIHCDLKITVRT